MQFVFFHMQIKHIESDELYTMYKLPNNFSNMAYQTVWYNNKIEIIQLQWAPYYRWIHRMLRMYSFITSIITILVYLLNEYIILLYMGV